MTATMTATTRFALGWLIVLIAGGSLVTAAVARAEDSPAATAAGGDDPNMLAYNNHCRTCHSINEGDNRLGPALHGIVGRKAGSAPGYGFSPVFKSSELVWTEENLDRFIADPNSLFPGSNMATFAGLTSKEDRAKIIAHLKTLK